jgi:glycosyltransferase involved in cell wall biosynthesis
MDADIRSIKVLMLSHYFGQHSGGIEAVAGALAQELAARGFQVLWLASGNAAADGPTHEYRRESLAAAGIAERLLAIPYPLLRPSAWGKIWREASRHDVIVVHDAVYMASVLGYLAARRQRKPLVLVQHVAFVPFQSALLRALMHIANRCIAAPLLRGADQVIFISELTKQYFAQIRWRRAPMLVFNGVDTTTFWPAADTSQVHAERRKLGLPEHGAVVLFVGRFVEKKGLRALQSAASVCTDVRFVFAGHGPLDPAGWNLPNVRVCSGLSGARLASLYRASNVLVLPSAGEGFPLVVQEALACGLAVICGSDTATADPRAAPYLIGIPVEIRDPEATARRLVAELTPLLGRSSLPAERLERAAFARTRYSWAATGASYAELLRRLCPPSVPLPGA